LPSLISPNACSLNSAVYFRFCLLLGFWSKILAHLNVIHTPQRGNTTQPRVKPWEMPPNQFHRPVGAGQDVVGCLRSLASEIAIVVRRDRHHGFVISRQAKVRFVPPRWGGDGWRVPLQGFHPWLCCFAPLGHAIHTPYRGGNVRMEQPRGFNPLASLFSPLEACDPYAPTGQYNKAQGETLGNAALPIPPPCRGGTRRVVGCLRSLASEISIMVRRDRHH
jgi:hypothetical protein